MTARLNKKGWFCKIYLAGESEQALQLRAVEAIQAQLDKLAATVLSYPQQPSQILFCNSSTNKHKTLKKLWNDMRGHNSLCRKTAYLPEQSRILFFGKNTNIHDLYFAMNETYFLNNFENNSTIYFFYNHMRLLSFVSKWFEQYLVIAGIRLE